MTKKVTRQQGDDRTTSRGTVKGHHADPDDRVPEGGPAPAPTEGPGMAKGSASKAIDEGAAQGEDTSTATAGKREKERAEAAGSMKPQSGRDDREREG